jgi:hypothetical protein
VAGVAGLRGAQPFEDPSVVRWLFSSPRVAWVWFVVRLYLGYQWLAAGREKLDSPGWVSTGTILQAFWQRAVCVNESRALRPGRPAPLGLESSGVLRPRLLVATVGGRPLAESGSLWYGKS